MSELASLNLKLPSTLKNDFTQTALRRKRKFSL